MSDVQRQRQIIRSADLIYSDMVGPHRVRIDRETALGLLNRYVAVRFNREQSVAILTAMGPGDDAVQIEF